MARLVEWPSGLLVFKLWVVIMNLKTFLQKTFYVGNPKTSFRDSYIRSVLFINPTIVLGLCFFLGGTDSYFRRCGYSLMVATMVSHFCFLTVYIFANGELKIAQILKKPRPIHGRAWYFSISMLAMPLGLFLAATVMNKYGFLLGFQGQIDAEDFKKSIFIATLIAAFYFLLQTRWDLKETTAKAEKEKMQAQISALTAQMNPHLLFNALNTIASLVESNPKRAEETILKLSELYRGVLNASKKATHSLADELALCDAYLSVEQARFGDRLAAETFIDSSLKSSEIQVPTLSIQPLVENAVKHGLSSKASGGKVSIRVGLINEKLEVVVADNGVGMGHSLTKGGTGSGLSNCRERLRLQYGIDGTLDVHSHEDQGTKVSLKWPLNVAEAIS